MAAPIGSKVYAYTIEPGTIIEPCPGDRFNVSALPVLLGGGWLQLRSDSGRVLWWRSSAQVKVLGYFNPDR
jgi:hypothetical protein